MSAVSGDESRLLHFAALIRTSDVVLTPASFSPHAPATAVPAARLTEEDTDKREQLETEYCAEGRPAQKALHDAARTMLGRPLQTDHDILEFAVHVGAGIVVQRPIAPDMRAVEKFLDQWHRSMMNIFKTCDLAGGNAKKGNALLPSDFRCPTAGERRDYALLHMLVLESLKLHSWRFERRRKYLLALQVSAGWSPHKIMALVSFR